MLHKHTHEATSQSALPKRFQVLGTASAQIKWFSEIKLEVCLCPCKAEMPENCGMTVHHSRNVSAMPLHHYTTPSVTFKPNLLHACTKVLPKAEMKARCLLEMRKLQHEDNLSRRMHATDVRSRHSGTVGKPEQEQEHCILTEHMLCLMGFASVLAVPTRCSLHTPSDWHITCWGTQRGVSRTFEGT